MPNNDRRIESRRFRVDAADLAFNRNHPDHTANGDEQRFASANYAMSFTKGLDHDPNTGLVRDKNHFEAFRSAIDNGVIEDFTTRVPVPREVDKNCKDKRDRARRQWEAPTAGLVFDLEGPDAQAVTMPPAPAMCSDELTFEMAEVYELALLRDVPFAQFDEHGASPKLNATLARLNHMEYIKHAQECCEFEGRPRIVNEKGLLEPQNVFRGSSPGVDKGPYLSAFMLMGNGDQTGNLGALDGQVRYGAQVIDQKVPQAPVGDDYMVDQGEYLEVQQGFAVQAADCSGSGQALRGQPRRFIHTPRDLATYVHFDALYQAYLNACLILLGDGTAFDPAFDKLSGSSGAKVLIDARDQSSTVGVNAGGFALYGGPHILTLVTEVATRALKAVRFQKFNTHIRLRPEALAARLEWSKAIEKTYPAVCDSFTKMKKDLTKAPNRSTPSLIDAIMDHNASLKKPNTAAKTCLLPMAFAEGSPMHPAYGAGHATVAGACVTILKAFFDTSALLVEITRVLDKNDCQPKREETMIGFYTEEQIAGFTSACNVLKSKVRYIKIGTNNKGTGLTTTTVECPLTLEGELNKLAANISIGRNMAGVHYFTDYFDSVRMGEEIAIGMLEEQAIGYPTDPFVMSVPTFDGPVERIGAR